MLWSQIYRSIDNFIDKYFATTNNIDTETVYFSKNEEYINKKHFYIEANKVIEALNLQHCHITCLFFYRYLQT